jgi:peptidoglycan/xylan/chitin deacetylase (PgdA/CDA1 family)
VGEMMAAKVFGDETIYVPEGFGVYVTPQNAAALDIFDPNPDVTGYIYQQEKTREVELPILNYHHIVPEGEATNLATTTEEKFKSDMLAVKNAGFNTVLYEDVIKFANGESEYLPPKPLLITMDDGYESEYALAYKILRELGMKANINIIGETFGSDVFPGSGQKIIPHFGYSELGEMTETPRIIDFGSHSFAMHRESPRDGALRNENETTMDYYNKLKSDSDAFKNAFLEYFTPEVFCYPYGKANILSDKILESLGYKMTLLLGDKTNIIAYDRPYTLYGLYRFNAAYDIPSEDLVNKISQNFWDF